MVVLFLSFSLAATVVEIWPTHLVFPAIEEIPPLLYPHDPALL
jgi:hypothetical protein